MSKNKFFKLDESIAQKLIEADLSQKAMKLWLYLITKNPFGDREEPLIFELIERDLGLKKHSFYRAKAELQQKQLFDFTDTHSTFRSVLKTKEDKAVTISVTPVAESVTPVAESVTELQNQSQDLQKLSQLNRNSHSSCRISHEQGVEANNSNGSKTSQTNSDLYRLNKTNLECVQTLTREEDFWTHTPEKNEVKIFSLEEEEERLTKEVISNFNQKQEKPKPKIEIQEDTNSVATDVEVLKNESSAGSANVIKNIDKMTWQDFDWIDNLYANYRPSRWKAEYPLKVKKVLEGLKESLKDMDGDVLRLQCCVKNAFRRVESNPSLWGCSFAWVMSYDNLQQLAWEYEAEISLAPSRKLQYKKQENDVLMASFEQLAEQYV